MSINYQIVNGTFYHENTPKEVIDILERSRKDKVRIRIFYGDVNTGRDWLEEYDTIGTIGRSGGDVKLPLLLKNERSGGGGAIVDHCIVRITIDKKEVYRNANYKTPNLIIRENTNEIKNEYPFNVFSLDTNKVIANCKSRESANRLIDFWIGKRNCK